MYQGFRWTVLPVHFQSELLMLPNSERLHRCQSSTEHKQADRIQNLDSKAAATTFAVGPLPDGQQQGLIGPSSSVLRLREALLVFGSHPISGGVLQLLQLGCRTLPGQRVALEQQDPGNRWRSVPS